MGIISIVRCTAFALGTSVLLAGCTMDKREAPEFLTGPSGFAMSMRLTAESDRLLQDGSSQVAITALVMDVDGLPVPVSRPVKVAFSAVASDGSSVTLTDTTAQTDANGRAKIAIVAPPAPAFQPRVPVTVTVTAAPIGGDLNGTVPRTISVMLQPPAGTPPPNDAPVASFTFTPATPTANGIVTFDASASTDEGTACGSSCTYSWTFGDGSSGTGMFVSHIYSNAGSYTVTLTVTDARGTSSRPTSQSVPVSLPDAPTADVVVSPTDPVVDQEVYFDAGGSAASTGATIVQYSWVFGDGESTTTTTAQAPHTYRRAGDYVARVTVTDNFGRTATDTVSITVDPIAP